MPWPLLAGAGWALHASSLPPLSQSTQQGERGRVVTPEEHPPPPLFSVAPEPTFPRCLPYASSFPLLYIQLIGKGKANFPSGDPLVGVVLA